MMKNPKPPDKATLVERIQFYINTKQMREAKALALLGDTLEEAFSWDTEFI